MLKRTMAGVMLVALCVGSAAAAERTALLELFTNAN